MISVLLHVYITCPYFTISFKEIRAKICACYTHSLQYELGNMQRMFEVDEDENMYLTNISNCNALEGNF